ncbi:hypothetical protein OUZ56_022232 [Daphnia magna]|uniref:Uncharacterized protein n=1 Tax=Daphnia magna TaxID=35525 RepID=A0ABR0AVR8_9CRUS|nr:hypothetical protein OUZ56_022232 [Daphnia magna]
MVGCYKNGKSPIVYIRARVDVIHRFHRVGFTATCSTSSFLYVRCQVGGKLRVFDFIDRLPLGCDNS